MTEQEARWLYARGLEITMLINGKPENWATSKKMTHVDVVPKKYHEIAIELSQKIMFGAVDLLRIEDLKKKGEYYKK